MTLKASESSKLNERTGTLDGAPPFSYFESVTTSSTPFVNTDSSLWVLVLGAHLGGIIIGSQQALEVVSPTGKTINSVIFIFQTAAGVGWATFKKMLVPPGGKFITSTGTIDFQAIKGKFDDIIRLI